jgi:ankyrin repeat protein
MFFDYKQKIKEFLEENNGDVNEKDEDGNTLLHYAAKHNLIKLVWKLKKENADFSIVNSVGDTPLHVACKHHNLDVAEEIFRKYSRKNSKNLEGKKPLNYLTYNERISFGNFEDRFLGSGKYEYKEKPEVIHQFGNSRRKD